MASDSELSETGTEPAQQLGGACAPRKARKYFFLFLKRGNAQNSLLKGKKFCGLCFLADARTSRFSPLSALACVGRGGPRQIPSQIYDSKKLTGSQISHLEILQKRRPRMV